MNVALVVKQPEVCDFEVGREILFVINVSVLLEKKENKNSNHFD